MALANVDETWSVEENTSLSEALIGHRELPWVKQERLYANLKFPETSDTILHPHHKRIFPTPNTSLDLSN